MNIYYLKKFRKEAQKRIKAEYNPSFLGDKYPYNCSDNGFYIQDTLAEELCEIKQILLICRRNYILKLTRAERAERHNKQLAKL